MYVSTRRGPRHPGWSRRHFRVGHHQPLTVIIDRAALRSRVRAARRDLEQVESAIGGLAGHSARIALMQHVRSIGFALDDIDSAVVHARAYRGGRRGWVVLDQSRFWRRLRAAENALAQLDDEVAGLQNAQQWNGHARLGGLDTNLNALGDTLMGADAYRGQGAASRPAAMSVPAFEQLERSLHATTFRKDKFDLVRSAVFSDYFTTVQARAVARQIHAGTDKVTVLTWLYPRVVDPDRFDMVMADLPTNGDRRRLEANVYGQ
ncbi:MAG: hypothetical protein ACI9U2_003346 [Bradymonadia bacterium]|jgi:hypothetical protein